VVEATSDNSGTLVVNSGDVIEAQLLGAITFSKFLEVRNVTDTITLYSDTNNSNRIYSFVAAASKTYSIYGEIDS
jgi:hypothetical protein